MTRDEAITEITRRPVEVCQPVRVYLFGSVALGDDGPDSDPDFLSLSATLPQDDAPDEVFRGGKLARARRGFPYAADWSRGEFRL
jgi:predicted nucleotidyltransferase